MIPKCVIGHYVIQTVYTIPTMRILMSKHPSSSTLRFPGVG